MSRSGYVEDLDHWDLIRWRGAVNSAIKGKRGQAFLRELLEALDAMPRKRLIVHDLLDDEHGDVCSLGCIGQARGIDVGKLDPYDHESLSKTFGIAAALVKEIEFENDDGFWGGSTPENRWKGMREWVAKNIHLSSQ